MGLQWLAVPGVVVVVVPAPKVHVVVLVIAPTARVVLVVAVIAPKARVVLVVAGIQWVVAGIQWVVALCYVGVCGGSWRCFVFRVRSGLWW